MPQKSITDVFHFQVNTLACYVFIQVTTMPGLLSFKRAIWSGILSEHMQCIELEMMYDVA